MFVDTRIIYCQNYLASPISTPGVRTDFHCIHRTIEVSGAICCYSLFQVACPIFPGTCVEVQRPDATLQLFQLPVPQLAGFFFFLSVLAFLPIGLRVKSCEIDMLRFGRHRISRHSLTPQLSIYVLIVI